MEHSKMRCLSCYKYFCCNAHRADHEVKNHPEMLQKLKENYILKSFQKRAEHIILKSRKRQITLTKEKNEIHLSENTTNIVGKSTTYSLSSYQKPAIKRLYSEMNKRFLSTSVTVSAERKILIPVHRGRNSLIRSGVQSATYLSTKCFSKNENESPCETGTVKTSTPIVDDPPDHKTPQSKWENISLSSNISVYETPQGNVGDFSSERNSAYKTPLSKGLVIVTPLRSIMSKTSKYVCDNEMGPSPSVNSSKVRRVTFSFSSKVSSTGSSPLESVPEVETDENMQHKNNVPQSNDQDEIDTVVQICKEIQDRKHYLVEVNKNVEQTSESKELLEYYFQDKSIFVDDSPKVKESGFFSCMANIFCSAVQNIPKFSSWHYTKSNLDRSKRSRSPDKKDIDIEEIQSPLQKRRRCYPCDLRLNPIQSRRPLSHS